MLSLNSGYRYCIYRGVTDFRCGMDSLSGTVRKELSIDPTGGEILVYPTFLASIQKTLIIRIGQKASVHSVYGGI